MPQAPNELRAKFPGHDYEALEILKANFIENKGVICRKDLTYQPTQREWEAIDYLFLEWDYVFNYEKFSRT